MKKAATKAVLQAFNIAIRALKEAGLERAEVNLERIQSNYEWSTRFSMKTSFADCELETKQSQNLKLVLQEYACAVFESDEFYHPMLYKKANYGSLASFVLTVNSAKVDINFRTLKVDCLTIGYLQHEVQA